MDDSNEEDLMDLFTKMGSHSLPPKSNFKAAIETMAILQEPKYIFDCFSISMAQVQQHLSDKTSVLFLYDSKQPTGKCVAELLVTTNAVPTRVDNIQSSAAFGHTCVATLEVPCTYSSYTEFCSEFHHILSRDCQVSGCAFLFCCSFLQAGSFVGLTVQLRSLIPGEQSGLCGSLKE
ncbi:hypothetical protein AMECASPLE_008520 [Ameca splendens]|uniref:Uncharacterized protein n=1 Tax=Ameca splendens TaxID=208324 RepID=A0ABV0XD31_9TELE